MQWRQGDYRSCCVVLWRAAAYQAANYGWIPRLARTVSARQMSVPVKR